MNETSSTYDEQLPWLEAVEDEDGPRGVSARRMAAALGVVLLAALIVAATFFWLGRRNAADGAAPELIRAPAEPYKVRPADPGGLDVAGESQTAFETSAGEDHDARLDLGALPEEPIARPEPAPEPKRIPPNETKVPDTTAPEPKPETPSGAPGSTIQLGAYKSAAQAQRGWDALSARFPALGGMTKLIIPYSGGYRLRAGTGSPEQAKQACQLLRVAGENCFVAK